MKRFLLGGLILLFGYHVAKAQAPFTDGAANPNFRVSPAITLKAPDIPPFRMNMPKTVEPFEAGLNPFDYRLVGYSLPIKEDILAKAPWQDAPDGGKVCRVELTSLGATGLRVQLTDIALAHLELRVYKPGGQAIYGPYTRPQLDPDGTWWSTIAFGERIGLEFYAPPGAPLSDKTRPKITKVMFMYAPLMQPNSITLDGGCDLDAVCYPSWINNEGQAIGYMLFNCANGSCGQCTGALITRNPQDFAPIFMTARHCVGDQTGANSLIVFWFYQNDSCNGTTPNRDTRPRNDGSLLLKTDSSSDWTLLGLYQVPMANFYVGWDASYLGNGSAVFGVHHGGGNPKLYCAGTKIGDTNCGAVGASNEWDISYSQGRTFPGASGSPLFDAAHRVRGTLSCDNRQCPPSADSNYGRLDTAFGTVSPFLFNMASPTYVNWGFVGFETGTAGSPFATVYPATFCVRTGDTVLVRAGSYNEKFRVWRAMTLKTQGGTVRIGAP